jgi:hypothetical protein
LGQLIALYEFGAVDEDQQRAFLDHLVECEYCYGEVYSLEPIMTTFREHRNAAAVNGTCQIYRALLSRLLRSKRTWHLMAALAVLSVALIVGGLFFYGRPSARVAPLGRATLDKTAEGKNIQERFEIKITHAPAVSCNRRGGRDSKNHILVFVLQRLTIASYRARTLQRSIPEEAIGRAL